MENEKNSPKRSLRDVSHLFLSSMSPKETNSDDAADLSAESVSEVTADSSFLIDAARDNEIQTEPFSGNDLFTRPQALSVFSIIPIALDSYSIVLHIYLAKLLAGKTKHLYIVSANATPEAWKYVEKQYTVCPYNEIQGISREKRFSLTEKISLVIIAPERIPELLNTSFADTTKIQEPAIVLLDLSNVDSLNRLKLSSLVDTFYILTSPRIDDLQQTYKFLKTHARFYPQVRFKCVLQDVTDSYFEEFLNIEFNQLCMHFLNMYAEFIGSCDWATFERVKDIDKDDSVNEQIFNINCDDCIGKRKETYSKECSNFLYAVTM